MLSGSGLCLVCIACLIRKTELMSISQMKLITSRIATPRLPWDVATFRENIDGVLLARPCKCYLRISMTWLLKHVFRQNSVEELYSLLKFLQIRPLNDWSTFNEQINKPVKAGRQVRAMKRLHVSSICLLCYRRLIFSPPRSGHFESCYASPEERPHAQR